MNFKLKFVIKKITANLALVFRRTLRTSLLSLTFFYITAAVSSVENDELVKIKYWHQEATSAFESGEYTRSENLFLRASSFGYRPSILELISITEQEIIRQHNNCHDDLESIILRQVMPENHTNGKKEEIEKKLNVFRRMIDSLSALQVHVSSMTTFVSSPEDIVEDILNIKRTALILSIED